MHYAYNGFVMLVILYLSAYLHEINSKTSKKPEIRHFRSISGSFPVKIWDQTWLKIITVQFPSASDIYCQFKIVSGLFPDNFRWKIQSRFGQNSIWYQYQADGINMANLNPFPVISGLIGSHQKLRRKISGGVLGGFSDIRSTYVPQKSILGVFGCGKPNRTVTVKLN